MLFLSLAAAIVCGCSADAGPTASQGNLTFREFNDLGNGRSMLGTMGYGFTDGKAPSGYSKPAGVSAPVFVSIQVGRTGNAFVGLIAKSKASLSAPDLVWVDWNGDKKFGDDEKALKADTPSLSNATTFKPVTDPVIGSRPVKLALAVAAGGMVSVIPSGYMEGSVDLEGKTVKVGVVDVTGNGVYGDVFDEKSSGDILLFDRNGDGVFDLKAPTTAGDMFRGEVLPLLSVMSLGGSNLYEVSVRDGAMIQIASFTGATGPIEFSGAKASFLLVNGPKGLLFAEPGTGANRLPVGSYDMVGAEYKIGDESAPWTVDIGPKPGQKLQVAADKPLAIKCGPPFSMAIGDTVEAGMHSFSLTLKDGSGWPLQSLTDAKGERPAAPQLVITDVKGKIVQKLAFSYG